MINREDLLSGTRPEVGGRILVTERENFQGYEIMDYKGMVWGISIRSKDVIQDIAMGFRQFFGGELKSYTDLSDEARHRALNRLLEAARRIGANAVINFRFEISTNQIAHNTEVVAYGNAVVIRPIKNYVPTGGLGNILAEFVDTYTVAKISAGENPRQEKSPEGKVAGNNEFRFVCCPECKTKYKLDVNENGNSYIKGLQDVDAFEPGTQVYCIKCGTKFTIPEV